jgi:hypothetical protein
MYIGKMDIKCDDTNLRTYSTVLRCPINTRYFFPALR